MERMTTYERLDALKTIFAEAPTMSAEQAHTFLSTVEGLALRLHRLYVHACNRQLTELEEFQAANIEKQLRAHFEGYGLGLYLNSDPRGNPVGIMTPVSGRYNTMGGREVGWRL